MRQRICYFLVVFVFGFWGNISGQGTTLPDSLEKNRLTKFCPELAPSCWIRPAMQKEYLRRLQKDSVSKKAEGYFLLNPVPASFYSNNLGFFCQKELKLEKLTSVPFRFRLGSLDYVNYLEQKPNALKPQ